MHSTKKNIFLQISGFIPKNVYLCISEYKERDNMKNIYSKSKQCLVLIFSLFAIASFYACEKETYVDYTVEGKIIDKNTKEPVGNIFISFAIYDNFLPQGGKTQKYSPIEYDGRTDENGKFRAISHRLEESAIPSLFYIYGYGLYEDRTISVDFSNTVLTGKPSRKWKGEYILSIGDIELEKIN